jgi:hypothetical protein
MAKKYPAIKGKGVSVKSYGAHGNGTDDDTTHIGDAIAAAAGMPVYFPAGTYLIAGGLDVPSGTRFVGDGMATTHLKGHLHIGSNTALKEMKIGEDGAASFYHANGASNVTFTRVQFRGGGYETEASRYRPVIGMGGTQGAISNVTFTACNIECNLGTENELHTLGLNNVSMGEVMDDAAHLENITFNGCTFGVSNGVRTGSPRMHVEMTSRLWNGGPGTHYAQNIHFMHNAFEFSDESCLDIESEVDAGASLGNFTIHGNLFKGAGADDAKWGQCLCLEAGQYAEVTGNTFWGGKYGSIQLWDAGVGKDGYDVITGNTIDDTLGHPTHTKVISITTNHNVFTGNTITSVADPIMENTGEDNTLIPNTINGVDSGAETTLGNTSILASGQAGSWEDKVCVSPYTIATGALVSKVSVYFDNNDTGNHAFAVKAVICSDVTGEPAAVLATGDEATVAANYLGWKDLPFASPVELLAGTYHFGFAADEYAWNAMVPRDWDGPPSTFTAGNDYSAGIATPLSSPSETSDQRLSMHTTYTPQG